MENISFNDYILSRSNRKAAEKCFDLARNKSEQGKILFVQGPSSGGKTHLLRKTAEVYYKKYNEEALAVHLREMTDDIIKSVIENNKEAFYEKYSSGRLLLVDDFHGIIGFSATQRELATVFIRLVEQGVNIILFSEYKLNQYANMLLLLEDKADLTQVTVSKADLFLRKRVLENLLADGNGNVSGRVFRYIVLNKKISIASFKGCIAKIRLTEKLEGDKTDNKKIIKALEEYKR